MKQCPQKNTLFQRDKALVLFLTVTSCREVLLFFSVPGKKKQPNIFISTVLYMKHEIMCFSVIWPFLY